MAVAFRAANSGTYNSTSGTATIPGSAQVDDLLVLYSIRSTNTSTVTTPSGWTRVIDPLSASSLSLAVYTRIAQSGDAGSNVTIQWEATGRVTWGIAAYSGVDTTTPMDATPAATAFLTASASTNHTTPSVTATNSNTYSVDLVVNKAASLETSFTPPGGVTEDHQYLHASTSSPNFAIGHEDTDVASGASGGGNTWTTVQSSQYIVATLLLRSSAPAPEVRTASGTITLSGTGTAVGGTPIRTASGTVTLSGTASRIGSVATLTHAWAGGVTSSSFVVTSKLASASSVRLAVSTSSTMSSPTYVSAQTPDGSGRVRHVATGLSPETRYYYRLADTASGTETMVGAVGTIKTLQTAGTPVTGTRKVLIGACLRTNSTEDVALLNAMAWGPDWGQFNGDFFYSGSTSTTVSVQAAQWDNALSVVPSLKEFTAAGLAAYYNTSDHEAGPDNGDSDNAYTAANISAYKQIVPYGTLLDPAGTTTARDQQWDDGRISYYMIDCRTTDRSPGANTDNSSKTMLGAAQKARLLAWLSTNTSPFKVIISDVQWMGPTSESVNKPDAWWAYDNERQQIITAINAAQASGVHVELWHGDSHLIGYATSAKNIYGGFPVLCAAGYDQDGGGRQTSTFSAFWNNSSGDVNQYGRVTFTDDGTTITRTFSGWDADADVQRVSDTITVDTTPVRTATGSITLSGTATAFASYTRTATGSVTLTGTGVVVEREVVTASSGVTLSGTAAVVEKEYTTPTGTITLSGTAVAVPVFTRTATGSVALSGTGIILQKSIVTGTGSITLSGTADGQASGGTPSRTATGGITLSGTAVAVARIAVTATSGITLSGTAPILEREITTATSGVVLSGTATASASGGTNTRTADGTITLTGTATVIAYVVVTATGTLNLTGTGSVSESVTRTAMGQLTLAGSAIAMARVTRTATGTIVLGGYGQVGDLPTIPDVRKLRNVTTTRKLTFSSRTLKEVK